MHPYKQSGQWQNVFEYSSISCHWSCHWKFIR